MTQTESFILADASDLYRAWSVEVRSTVPWERLSNQEQAAWQAVVDLASDGLRVTSPETCSICGLDLVCSSCEEIDCSQCGKTELLLCEDCWLERRRQKRNSPGFETFEIQPGSALSLCQGESR